MWYKRKTKPQDIENIKKFCKEEFGARVRLTLYGGSSCICSERLIELDRKEIETVQELYSMTFHELAHLYCYDNDLYYIFHNDSLPDKEMKKYMKKMGVRAEKFVDKKGKELMKKFFPKIPFVGAYDDPKNVVWLKKWIEKNYGKAS